MAARIRSSPPKSSGVSTMWTRALVSPARILVAYERAGGPQLGMYCSKTPFRISQPARSQPSVASMYVAMSGAK